MFVKHWLKYVCVLPMVLIVDEGVYRKLRKNSLKQHLHLNNVDGTVLKIIIQKL